MRFELFALLVAAGGGFLGAAVGGLNAFVVCGFLTMVGGAVAMAGGGTGFLDDVALGPFFGPHVAFAAGVAAVAFAARRPVRVPATLGPVRAPGDDDRPVGKDVGRPLVALERPGVLLVGAAVGMLGYLLQGAIAAVPGFGTRTDGVALAVVVLGVATRLAFGSTGLVTPGGLRRRGAGAETPWISYHSCFVPCSLLGLFVGLLAGGVTVALATRFPALGADAKTFVFGLSAFSLLFLSLGKPFPVTHHISLVAGAAAVAFLPVTGGNVTLALLAGAAGGIVAAWLGEAFARLWHDGGDTHLDPPASAIWPGTTLVLLLAAAVG